MLAFSGAIMCRFGQRRSRFPLLFLCQPLPSMSSELREPLSSSPVPPTATPQASSCRSRITSALMWQDMILRLRSHSRSALRMTIYWLKPSVSLLKSIPLRINRIHYLITTWSGAVLTALMQVERSYEHMCRGRIISALISKFCDTRCNRS